MISKLFWRPLLVRKRLSKPGWWWEWDRAKMCVAARWLLHATRWA